MDLFMETYSLEQPNEAMLLEGWREAPGWFKHCAELGLRALEARSHSVERKFVTCF
jgi:hypothetical protein